MKNFGKYILIGLIALLALIAVYKGCQVNYLRDKANNLQGQLDTLKKATDKAMAEALVYMKKQDATITEQTKIIELKDVKIAEQNRHIIALDSSLATLEADYSTITDKDAAIRNLLLQIGVYKEKCLAFESIIEDKDAQLGGWMIKFEAQAGISKTWKARYEEEHNLRLVAEDLASVQGKRLKSLQFGSSLKTWIIGGAAAYLGYSLIRGK